MYNANDVHTITSVYMCLHLTSSNDSFKIMFNNFLNVFFFLSFFPLK